jgi:ATP-dependent protease ClpP protease subunit
MEDFYLEDFVNAIVSNIANANLQLPDPDLIQYYTNLKNRVYWIDKEIDNNTLDLVDKILKWNKEDSGKPVEERQPIKLMFNSPGGNLDVEETLVSVIELSKTPVYGYALGMVASAASLIFLSCHKRFALPNAYLLLHKGSYSSPSANYNELMAAMDDYRIQISKMVDFYIRKTKIPEEIVRKKIETDWYIRGEDLITNGLIDDWVRNIEELL